MVAPGVRFDGGDAVGGTWVNGGARFALLTVAAAEVAVGLALLVALYRARQTTDVDDITSLKF